MDERKIQIIICKCNACELLGDVPHLGVGGSEEFTPGGQFIEDVPDLDGCADIRAAGAEAAFIPTINLDSVGPRRIFDSANGLNLCD